MEIDIQNLPQSPELLAKIIIQLQQSLQETKSELNESRSELISFKEKYIRLIEEFRLAKQQRFAPSSEKNILQADLFDEAGVELPDEVKAQLKDDLAIEVKAHIRPKECS